MAVPRTKKRKKSAIHKPTKTPLDIVTTTNYLWLAMILRSLYTVYGWRTKRIADFIECIVSLLEEIHDGRTNVAEFIKDTEKMTGFNAKKILDELFD